MDIFEYLPQLIIAYDGNDEFANLIHIKKADKQTNYYCPCCGGCVKPRALASDKEQSHYYHITGKCTKESQLHYFCKNWLFEIGSKFYIDKELFVVDAIDVGKTYSTLFGDYTPDITVRTSSGRTIFFEMFFSNRKTGNDYFCKWNSLGNDVVEVNIKEYMVKTNKNVVPVFKYLYHDGSCYSKSYKKRDLYATTIARIKRKLTRQKVLNYMARIEQLDWFWQKIRNNDSRELILQAVATMAYEDMIACYAIIKRKQCVSYLKNDVLEIINQKVIADVRKSLELPDDDHIYFDLKHIHGRTYEAGIRLKLKTSHIIYDDLYSCYDPKKFNRLNEFPKVIFNKNMHTLEEIVIPNQWVEILRCKFKEAVKYKNELIQYEDTLTNFEQGKYKIRVNNNLYTVLAQINNGDFSLILDNYYIKENDINALAELIKDKFQEKKSKDYLETIMSDEKYQSIISELQKNQDFGYKVQVKYLGNDFYHPTGSGIYLTLYFGDTLIYNEMLQHSFEDFVYKTNQCKKIISDSVALQSTALKLVERINNCNNNFWNAQISTNYSGYPVIEIDQTLFVPKNHFTFEKIQCKDLNAVNESDMVLLLEEKMKKVLKNMERCGYRVMEEMQNEE